MNILDDIPKGFGPEQALLGLTLLYGPECWGAAIKAGIELEDFAKEGHQEVFRRAEAIRHRNAFFTGESLLDECTAGTPPLTNHELGKLGEAAPAGIWTISVPLLAAELRRRRRRRELAALNDQLRIALQERDDDKASQLREEISEAEITLKPALTWADVSRAQIDWAESVIRGDPDHEEARQIRWPWLTMDQTFMPLKRGEMAVIGGGPSLGKSSFMRQCLLAAGRQGQHCDMVSMEVPAGEIMRLMATARSGIPSWKLKSMLRADQSDYLSAMKEVAGLEIEVFEGKKLADIMAFLRSQHNRRFLDLVAIDYLGLIEDCSPHKGQTKASAVGEVALAFKRLAHELQCVVLLGVQVNRAPFGEDRPPRLQDLKDSGDIEAHADRVILIHRPSENPLMTPAEEQLASDSALDRPRWYQELIQAKGRSTGTGSYPVYLHRECSRFESIHQEKPPVLNKSAMF